ncbi:hypothetical protein DUI87_28448 [Hirundo rustica rustica]|uniref:Uncharacterized protein n=1 Tax=Hirundo rustica rustica TaxID=333673 RepID=A0A3M0J205_HIRRU|nr:hypothetical protein DUI87_28448 [Hirundo rustica rustica]
MGREGRVLSPVPGHKLDMESSRREELWRAEKKKALPPPLHSYLQRRWLEVAKQGKFTASCTKTVASAQLCGGHQVRGDTMPCGWGGNAPAALPSPTQGTRLGFLGGTILREPPARGNQVARIDAADMEALALLDMGGKEWRDGMEQRIREKYYGKKRNTIKLAMALKDVIV